jgi:hypothetical protein
LSFFDLQNFLDEVYGDLNVDIENHLMPRMQDLIIDCFLSARDEFDDKNRANCFELFGFDFLIDEDFRTWLLEVNANPTLGTPNEYMKELVPRMLDDVVKLVVDSKFEPKVVDNSLENGFDIVYREAAACDCPEKEAVNLRRPFDVEICYPVSIENQNIEESIA